MLSMNDFQLDEFGEYLLKRSFCREGHEKFFVFWVRRFFRDSKEWSADSWDVLLQQYVNVLHDDPRVDEWQVEQAEKAVRLYFHNFRSGDNIPSTATASLEVSAAGDVNCIDLLSGVRQSLRVQNYSYRTEQTYIDWIRRFLVYAGRAQSGGTSEPAAGVGRIAGRPRDADSSHDIPSTVRVTEQSIKDYLAWLALERQVAASTQNQAFNALLFMARSALKLDLEEMAKGLRARTGKKLPVVLSPQETTRLLATMDGNRTSLSPVGE